MEIPEIFQNKAAKVLVAILASMIGLAAGYAVSTVVISEDQGGQQNYCQNLEQELANQYNTSSVMCHEPGWVALSSMSDEVENKTDLRCACTRINDGELTIFPIRAATG